MNPPFLAVTQFKESRLASLYSDFSHLENINPEGYQANHDAWVALLFACLRLHTFESSISLPGEKLSHALRNPTFGEPKSLCTTLDQQIQRGDWIPWSIYRDHDVKTHRGIVEYLSPQRVANGLFGTFALKFYSLRSSVGGVVADYFIAWSCLVTLGDSIYQKLLDRIGKNNSLSSRLFDEDSFGEILRKFDENLSHVDIHALIVYLSRDTNRLGMLKDATDPERLFLRIGDTKPLTEEEKGIIDLKRSIRTVESNIVSMETQLTDKIPEKLTHLQKTNASQDRLRNVLVRKLGLKKSLSKASNVHTQLSQILDKIDEAKSNVELFNSLKISNQVLSLLNLQVSLTEIDSLAADLGDEMALTDQVSDALLLSSEVDEDELDEELKILEKDETQQTANLINSSEEDLIIKLKDVTIDQKPIVEDSRVMKGNPSKVEKERRDIPLKEEKGLGTEERKVLGNQENNDLGTIEDRKDQQTKRDKTLVLA